MDKSQLLIWNTTGANIYTKSGDIVVTDNCNGFMVTNTGDTTVTVNGCVLFPGTVGSILGDSRTFGGNLGEIYKGVIRIAFASPPGAAPAVEIVQKFYIFDNHAGR